MYTSKDTWLGAKQELGCCGPMYNLTMDPFDKYDMLFNGAVSTRLPTTSPGRYAGYDNGRVVSLIAVPIGEFDNSIVDFPNMKRFPGGASNDTSPDLQHPNNPLPLMDIKKLVKVIGSGTSGVVRFALGRRRYRTRPRAMTDDKFERNLLNCASVTVVLRNHPIGRREPRVLT